MKQITLSIAILLFISLSFTECKKDSSAALLSAVDSCGCNPSGADTCCPINLSNGLIAYYPFNGNANDASGNGHHGTIVGTVQSATDRNGQANSSYSFDGSTGYINAGNFITGLTSFTFSFWVNIDSYTNTDYMTPFCQGPATYPPNQATFAFYTGNELDATGFQGGWNGSPITYYDLRNNNLVLPYGLWRHIVIRYDGVTLKQYINGVLIKQVSASGKTLGNTSNLLIGKGYAYPLSNLVTSFFDGQIDDVRIYNRALCNNEVLELLYRAETASGSRL